MQDTNPSLEDTFLFKFEKSTVDAMYGRPTSRLQDRGYFMIQGFFVSSNSSCPIIYQAHEDASPPMWFSSEPLPISVCTFEFDHKADLGSDPMAIDIDDEDTLTHSVASLVSLASMDLEDGDPYLSNVGTRQASEGFTSTDPGCPKSLLTEDDMAVHFHGHRSITFPCTMCGLIYSRQNELAQHQKECLG